MTAAAMARRRTLAAVSMAVALGAAAGALLWRARPGSAVGPSPAAPASPIRSGPAPFAFRWSEGDVYAYALAFASSGTFAMAGAAGADPGAPISASVALEGELALRSYGRLAPEGDFVLGVRLSRLDRAAWTLAAEPVTPAGGDALVGRELAVVVTPDGRIRSVNVAAADPALLVNVLRQVLGALQVTVASGQGAWQSWEENPLGQVLVGYEVRTDDPRRLEVRRRPARYTSLAASPVLADARVEVAGAAEVTLARAGHLARVEGQETVSATSADGRTTLHQETRVAARLLSIGRGPPGPAPARRLAGLVATRLGEVSAPPDTGRKLLAQRAAGLTMEGLLGDLRVHGGAATFPDAGRWMWRATGLLLLHPERCRELAGAFEAPGANGLLRGRVLDLLAATGSREAQAVLRRLLETPEARQAEDYGFLVQRLSLVQHPTPETVDYLRAQVERAHGEGALPAAYALGAAIGKRARAEGGAVDEGAATLLRARLAAARSPKEKADWLGTVGNAGLAEDVLLLAGYARDDAPEVRAAAAIALRTARTPEAVTALLALASDPSGAVRERALHTLARFALGPEDLAALGEAVRSGRLPPPEFAALATLLERNRHLRAAVLPVADAMLAKPIPDPRLVLRIRSLREAP